jgi:hypothetical protein
LVGVLVIAAYSLPARQIFSGKSGFGNFCRVRKRDRFPIVLMFQNVAVWHEACWTNCVRLPEFKMSISFPGVGAGATPTASSTKSSLTAKPTENKTAEQKFLEWAKMTPAERMHAQMLSQLGITEDQFKAMDPAAQQKIEDKIRDMIKKHAEDSNDKRTGLITDKTA